MRFIYTKVLGLLRIKIDMSFDIEWYTWRRSSSSSLSLSASTCRAGAPPPPPQGAGGGNSAQKLGRHVSACASAADVADVADRANQSWHLCWVRQKYVKNTLNTVNVYIFTVFFRDPTYLPTLEQTLQGLRGLSPDCCLRLLAPSGGLGGGGASEGAREGVALEVVV